MACTESRNAASPGLPFRLAKMSAPLPSGEYWTLALLTGSAPLLSHASPCAMAALSAAVSGASELYTTMTGVPLALGKTLLQGVGALALDGAGEALGGVVGGHALELGAHGEGAGDDDPDGDDDPRVPAA